MQRDIDRYILGIMEAPDILTGLEASNISLIRHETVAGIIRKRKRDSHKGTYGRVGILAGSKGMAGAAVLNCNAALRSGAGLVKACVTDSIYNVVEAMSLEAITYPFDENDIPYSDLNKELISFSDVIATGSGCANMKNYSEILSFLVESSEKPLILDAEGINTLDPEALKRHRQDIVLTPHYGEMARLIKKDTGYFREDIAAKASEFANRYNVFLVLKGPRTVISCPDGRSYINTTGNPGMATAGSGDVLTGMIAGLAGQGIGLISALRTAVYLHGLSGDLGSGRYGENSLIASDIISFIPEAMKTIQLECCENNDI